MSAKAVLTGNRILKGDFLKRHQGESHISAKEGETADSREVGAKIWYRWQVNDASEGELCQGDSGKENDDI